MVVVELPVWLLVLFIAVIFTTGVFWTRRWLFGGSLWRYYGVKLEKRYRVVFLNPVDNIMLLRYKDSLGRAKYFLFNTKGIPILGTLVCSDFIEPVCQEVRFVVKGGRLVIDALVRKTVCSSEEQHW